MNFQKLINIKLVNSKRKIKIKAPLKKLIKIKKRSDVRNFLVLRVKNYKLIIKVWIFLY